MMTRKEKRKSGFDKDIMWYLITQIFHTQQQQKKLLIDFQ